MMFYTSQPNMVKLSYIPNFLRSTFWLYPHNLSICI